MSKRLMSLKRIYDFIEKTTITTKKLKIKTIFYTGARSIGPAGSKFDGKNVYAHSCVDQGCTAVVIGSRAGVPDWIVWNCKDKYRQACVFQARRLMVSITLVVRPT